MLSKKLIFWWFTYLTATLGFITASSVAVEPKICKSLEITTPAGFEALRNCKIVVGHVRLVDMQITPKTAVPASIVEEITDYLLVYRVRGLTSLQRIFPRLKLIRGRDLLFNKYSLVVLENRELLNLGLISLLRIQSGNVRIEKNPVLCFVDTVNWIYILGNNTSQDISFKNMPSHQCPLCNETLADIDIENDGNLSKHCWNLDAFQRNTTYGSLNCTRNCGIYGCDNHGICCSPRCLTGCSDHDCDLCATLSHSKGCIDKCPFTYLEFNKRDCVGQSSCPNSSLIQYLGVCLESCPQHFKAANNTCINPCTGDYVIREAKDIAALSDCQVIRGSLTIELTEIKVKMIHELENGLSNIREITKYLKVKDSPQLMSLQFLSNLHTIRGDELIGGKYALYVVNNYHLEHIWNQNVAIFKGRIFFHLNPRLCYEKIVKLVRSVKSVQRLEAIDVSRGSNGERVVCGEGLRTLNASVEDLSTTAVRIKVNPMSPDDILPLIGYMHFYKEAPEKNVSWYDGRHGCGHDDWMMDISTGVYIRHVIRNLKPYTQYAYFVKTLTMVEYHTQLEAYSKIQYFRTMASKPGPVSKVYYHTLTTSEIMVHWWPPYSPNGNITYYLISYTKSKDNSSSDATTKYYPASSPKRIRDICKCQLKVPFFSGPLPIDDNYYRKDQVTYDDALSNFIYVSRPTMATTSENNSTQNQSSAESNNTETTTTTTANNGTVGAPIIPSNATNSTEIDQKEEAALRFQKVRLEQEQKIYNKQNAMLEDFKIVKPKPICPQGNVTTACRDIERFEGVHVPAHIHQHTIDKLQPGTIYNISVRACLDTDECGASTTILAHTISETLKLFLDNVQYKSTDIDE